MTALSDDQQRTADRVKAVFTAKRPDGSFKYSKEECRAFLVACVIELSLPLPKALEGVFLRFLDQIGVPRDADEDAAARAIAAHYEQCPLSPALLAEMRNVAAAQGTPIRDDFDRVAAAREQLSRLRATGLELCTRAPAPRESKSFVPKPRRGLS